MSAALEPTITIDATGSSSYKATVNPGENIGLLILNPTSDNKVTAGQTITLNVTTAATFADGNTPAISGLVMTSGNTLDMGTNALAIDISGASTAGIETSLIGLDMRLGGTLTTSATTGSVTSKVISTLAATSAETMTAVGAWLNEGATATLADALTLEATNKASTGTSTAAGLYSAGGTVTMTGEGAVSIKATATPAAATDAATAYGVYANGGTITLGTTGTVAIETTLTNVASTTASQNAYGLYINGAEVSLGGASGNVTIKADAAQKAADEGAEGIEVWGVYMQGGSLTINGATNTINASATNATGAIYAAGGATITDKSATTQAITGNVEIDGSTYNLESKSLTITGNLTATNGAKINATGESSSVTGTLSADASTITVGTDKNEAAVKFTAGTTTLENNSSLVLAGVASSGLTTFEATTSITIGQESSTDTSSITVGANSTLDVKEALTSYAGTTITVAKDGTLQTTASQTVTIGGQLNVNGTLNNSAALTVSGEGSTLAIGEGGKFTATAGSVTLADGAAGSFADQVTTALGTVNVNENATLELAKGASPTATTAITVNKGTLTIGATENTALTLGTSATLTLTDGTVNANGAVNVNDGGSLTVTTGDFTATGAVDINKGTFALNGGTFNAQDNFTITDGTSATFTGTESVLNVGKVFTLTSGSPDIKGTLNLEQDGDALVILGSQTLTVTGSLVTNSANLLAEGSTAGTAVADLPEALTQNKNIAGTLAFTDDEASLTITDEYYSADWVKLFTKADIGAYITGTDSLKKLLLTGQLLEGSKNPINVEYYSGMEGAVLGQVALDASPTGNDGNANLLIGTTTTDLEFDQPKEVEVNQIDGDAGFGQIQLGSGQYIQVSNDKSLTIIGGMEGGLVTSDSNNATIFVGYQGTTPTEGTLNLGDKDMALGGTLNGSIEVVNGALNVIGQTGAETPAQYSVTGNLTLGAAATEEPAAQATDGEVSITASGLAVQNLVIASQASTANSITVEDGTLTVNGALLTVQPDADAEEEVTAGDVVTVTATDSALTFGSIGSAPVAATATAAETLPQGPVTGAEFTLNNSSLTSNGDAYLTASTITFAASGEESADNALTINGTANFNDVTVTATAAPANITIAGELNQTASTIVVGEGSVSVNGATTLSGVEENPSLIILGYGAEDHATPVTEGKVEATFGDLTLDNAQFAISGAVSGGTSVEDGTSTLQVNSVSFGETTSEFIIGQNVNAVIGGTLDTLTDALTAVDYELGETSFDTIVKVVAPIDATNAEVSINGAAPAEDPTAGTVTIGQDGVTTLLIVDGSTVPFTVTEGTEGSSFSVLGGESTTVLVQNVDPKGGKLSEGFATDSVSPNTEIVSEALLFQLEWVPGAEPGTLTSAYTVSVDEEIADLMRPNAAPNTFDYVALNGATDAEGNILPGAQAFLDIINGVSQLNQMAGAKYAMDKLALQGVAAHAPVIGINAANMVVDSVWDHGSKLAGYGHESGMGDLWIDLNWNHSKADYKTVGYNTGYKSDLYGATIGADYQINKMVAAGLAFSIGSGDTKGKGINSGIKTDTTYWGLNLYSTVSTEFVNLIGNVGYLQAKNKVKGLGGDKPKADADVWTVGVRAEKQFMVTPEFGVTPHIGIRYLNVKTDSFNHGGFHYAADRANLVEFPIGIALSGDYKTASDMSVKPFIDLQVSPTAGDKKVTNKFNIIGTNAVDSFDSPVASTMMYQAKIGVNAVKGPHAFGLNFAIGQGGGSGNRVDTALQAKYRFTF